MIKTILITIILLAGVHSNAQFNQTWYTFRANPLVSMSITQEYYITGQLINYGGPLQYISAGDTFDIERQAVHDSVLFFWAGNRVQKLIFHKAGSSLSVIADTISKKELIRFYTGGAYLSIRFL